MGCEPRKSKVSTTLACTLPQTCSFLLPQLRPALVTGSYPKEWWANTVEETDSNLTNFKSSPPSYWSCYVLMSFCYNANLLVLNKCKQSTLVRSLRCGGCSVPRITYFLTPDKDKWLALCHHTYGMRGTADTALGTIRQETHSEAGNPVDEALAPSASLPEPEEAALMLVTCGNMSSCATDLTIPLSVPVQTTIKCGGGGYPHMDLGTSDSLASPRGPEICS